MKKRILAMLLAAVMVSSLVIGCGGGAADTGDTSEEETTDEATEEPAEEEPEVPAIQEVTDPLIEEAEEGQVIIPVGTFTTGEGIGAKDEKEATAYDAEHGVVTALYPDAEITYTVPEGVDGAYDVYLKVTKCLASFGSQPFIFSINDGDEFSVPIAFEVTENSPAANIYEGDYDKGDIMDSGRFPIDENVELKAGDTIKVTAAFGSRAGNLSGIVFPNVGSILLAPAGSEVPTGYDNTVKTLAEVDPSDPLSGLNIIWIGSSVTYGAHSGGMYSMVDAIADNHPGTVCEKYAVSSTTLVNGDRSSYVERLKLIPKDKTPDLIVVQLSTNDATTNKPYGELTDSTDPSTFDDTTIIGAIETIITYARETFDCPVVFYTGTYYEEERYADMVECLLEIQDKWGIGVIDMFDNEEMTAVYGTDQFDVYMSDDIHPYRIGYTEWWTPVIEQGLTDFVTSQE